VLAIVQSTPAETSSLVSEFSNFSILDYSYFLLCGIIASSAMIIPGVSGSFILILLGTYWIVLGALSGLPKLLLESGLNDQAFSRIFILGFLGVGVIIGILGFSRIMDWALKNHPAVTMYSILGLIIGSFYQIYPGFDFSLMGGAAILTFFIGILISIKFSDSK